MQINYKFISDIEPTEEQLHLLMQEVAIEAREKAKKSDKLFWGNLQKLVIETQNEFYSLNPSLK